ncbi:hypothetical protein FRC03_005070 [Tulasnella sp. 419]|nr:hypothetical protein FRC03_005070 [Tulasnella sp. 419]
MSSPDVSEIDISRVAGPIGAVTTLAAICIAVLVILVLGLFCWLIILFSKWRQDRINANARFAGEGQNRGAQRLPPVSFIPPYLQNVALGNLLRTFLHWSKTCLHISGVRFHLASFSHPFYGNTTRSPADDIESARGGGVTRAPWLGHGK